STRWSHVSGRHSSSPARNPSISARMARDSGNSTNNVTQKLESQYTVFIGQRSVKLPRLFASQHGFREELAPTLLEVIQPVPQRHARPGGRIGFERVGPAIAAANLNCAFTLTRVQHRPGLAVKISDGKSLHVRQYVGVRNAGQVEAPRTPRPFPFHALRGTSNAEHQMAARMLTDLAIRTYLFTVRSFQSSQGLKGARRDPNSDNSPWD